ncbi:MAG: hypothetical protein N3I35_17220 [Clostridia bacterium]|nr:hypothetical protein [Clostridia bacterium]
MPDRKKLYFWRLALIFGAITVLALAVSFGFNREREAGMMDTSMGNMMSSMHLKNITVSDLIKQQEKMESVTGQDSMAGHHSGVSSFLNSAHYLTTATIIILLPFIVAGTIFLAIIWLK